MLPMPAELIDLIFSFLHEDTSALQVCSKTHPSLSRLVERYLYADIILNVTVNLDVSSFLEALSKNPRILDYPRTLEIRAYASGISKSREVLSIMSMVPRMANLVSLKLHDIAFGSCVFQGKDFFSALRNFLQQSSAENLFLVDLNYFPLSILDNAKNIKKITFSYCKVAMEPMPKSPLQLLETLVIRNYPKSSLLIGMADRVANLKSLQLRDLTMTAYEWGAFPELLAACSSSLTELHIDTGECQSSYHITGSQTPVEGNWIRDDYKFPFTLASHKCLKKLSISSVVFSTTTPDETVEIYCALPAIMSLIKTAKAVQEVDLHLHWMCISSISLLDWSHLIHLQFNFPGNFPRIHLFTSGGKTRNPISPDIILDRESIILEPGECPNCS